MSLPPQSRLPLAVYRAVFPWMLALAAPGAWWRMRRRGNYREGFGQRFGWFTQEQKARLRAHRWTWIHSISVGETLVALKLARALHAADPTIRIALSVTTTTGFALARESAQEWLFPMYNPVDLRGCVRNVLEVLRPQRLVLIEGEVWPNLVAECFAQDIPVILANARLSPRSARRFARFRRWTAPVFDLLKWVGVPDEEDLALWEGAGVPRERLRLSGGIKFDQGQGASGASQAEAFRNLLVESGVPGEAPLLVAGSTHEGEEQLLVRMLSFWRRNAPDLRLVLVPRHVERAGGILRELASSGFHCVLRTRLPAAAAPDIVLVDTTGELRDWYELATVVFVGKSITASGGQNPAEPALGGKPVVCGPHMENFQVVMQHLLRAGGVVQAFDELGVQAALEELLHSPERRLLLSENARGALAIHQGAAARTAAWILETPAAP